LPKKYIDPITGEEYLQLNLNSKKERENLKILIPQIKQALSTLKTDPKSLKEMNDNADRLLNEVNNYKK